ncbi:hypothetical protein QTP25_31355, partial [Klebsiella oxytoca]|uniref:hypothetical protein n=1 Tax=Klebsiella oxytoca TaxID=571 RepID=UPI0025938BF0
TAALEKANTEQFIFRPKLCTASYVDALHVVPAERTQIEMHAESDIFTSVFSRTAHAQIAENAPPFCAPWNLPAR